jgi:hypothetical protein
VSRVLLPCHGFAFVILLAATTGVARAAVDSDAAAGKAILEKIARSAIRSKRPATAPLAKAPPLREVYLKYPIEQLEEGFAEGMGSRHRDMPHIQFSTEQVVAILSYLGGITGVDPWLRPRIPPSGQTLPSPTLRRGV